MNVIATPTRRRRAGAAEGDQRHRDDAAPRGLPEVARRVQPPRREVLGCGLRRQPARSGDVHRGHGAEGAAAVRVRARTRSRSRGTCAGSRAAGPTSGVSTLRFANIIGPTVRTPLTDYFTLPVMPDRAGLRRHGCSSSTRTTASSALRRATVADHPGTFNVAGDGVLTAEPGCATGRSAGAPGARARVARCVGGW